MSDQNPNETADERDDTPVEPTAEQPQSDEPTAEQPQATPEPPAEQPVAEDPVPVAAPSGGGDLWAGPVAQPVEQLPGSVRAEVEPDRDRRLLPGWNRPDPRSRPRDPAGSYPRHEADDLLPLTDEPLVIRSASPLAVSSSPRLGGTSAVVDIGDGPLPEAPQIARFQFVLGALIAVAVAGLLLLGYGLVNVLDDANSSSSSEGSAPWSAWAPTTSDTKAGAAQIAQHVGAEYKLPSGQQIVAVTGGNPEVAGLPLTVVLKHSPAQGGDYQIVNDKGVMYRLCGLGDKCAIAEGTASTERHLLLRREALELALYSFRYLKGVDQVVVLMPPKKGDPPEQALFFQKRDFSKEIDAPLGSTLVGATPGVTTMTSSPNASLVDKLTLDSLFKFSFQQENSDSSAFIVLER